MKYWSLEDTLGFGPGAHSNIGRNRFSFTRSLEKYIDGVTNGTGILDEYETLDELDRAAEYIMLGMRRSRGISGEEYYSIYRSDFAPIEELLREYEKDGWTKWISGRWSFTPTGFLLSNILIGSLLEAQAEYRIRANPWMEGTDSPETGRIVLPSGGDVF